MDSALVPMKPEKRLFSFLLNNKVPPLTQEHERIEYPEKTANFLSKVYFWWLWPLLRIGYKRTLQAPDLYKLTDELKVEQLTQTFLAHYHNNLDKSKEIHIRNKCKLRNELPQDSSVPIEEDLDDFNVSKVTVLKSLLATFKVQYSLAVFFVIISYLSQCLNPLLTKELIRFVQTANAGLPVNIGHGVGYAIGAVILVMLSGLAINHCFYRSMLTGAQVKGVLTKAILDKSFTLNSEAKFMYPSGKITSMMGTDCSRIDFALGFQPFLMAFPIPLIVTIVILIVNIGPVALVGVALMFIFLVAIGLSTKKLFQFRAKASGYTDSRVDYIKEVLNNLKIIKFYSWETAYHKKISEVRNTEMDLIYFMQILRNFVTAAALSLSLFASMTSFLVLYAVGSQREPAEIFSSVSLFNVFTSCLFMVPMAAASLADSLIGFERIGNYLAAPEAENRALNDQATGKSLEYMESNSLAIKMDHSFFEWELYEEVPDENENDDEKTKKKKEKKKKKTGLPPKVVRKNPKQKPESIDEKSEVSKTEEKVTNLTTSTTEDTSEDIKIFPGLDDIHLNIKKNEFIVITGLIGSGKSSLLNAMSGFMNRISGDVTVNGSLILCGNPWIQNATVTENIIFGKEFDKKKYDDVVYSCSLESDLEILPAGDKTEIGERGITLSGGQKARINLARAVYANQDIILLDDVLSAVDARVGKHIMNNCILGLLKDKTRILATHQLSLIGAADRVIFLNGDGTISVGTFNELKATNKGFNNLMAYNADDSDDSDNENEQYSVQELDQEEEDKMMIERQLTKHTTHTSISKRGTNVDDDEEAIHRDYNKDNTDSGKLIDEEGRAVNGIEFAVYQRYVKLGQGFMKNYSNVIVLFILICLGTFCFLFTNTWLSFWLELRFDRPDKFYIGIYIMFTFVTFFMMALEFTAIAYLTNMAARSVNILAINKMLRAPMSFLDTTPMGRILNRFTKDTDVLDNEIGDQLRFFLFSAGSIVGTLILTIIYLPWFAIAVPILVTIFLAIGSYYQATSREVKRLEAVQRSHVYNNFNEVLGGMSTIKAYKSDSRFSKKNNIFIDNMNEASFLTIAAQRWIGVNLDIIATIMSLVVCLLCVNQVFNISAASAGLIVSYIITISGQLSFLVRTYSQVENEMNSVERLCDYAYDLDEEAPYWITENSPPSDWPQKGGIEFDNASLAYRPGLPLVLKDLNFSVKPLEKIGICGRTGAGKSSIMTALYRLAELESGKVIIDGIDISKLGLKDLRSKLSIIPQDPVLFKGTIRRNLDPFEESTDAKLWDSLRRSGLIEGSKLDFVSHQKSDDQNLHKFHLDQVVEDDGSNFSLGEKQLIAFARALVRDSKILILDEATSSVDYETDSKIQSTIAREFTNCTILCIAHRLKTIVNYDKILVLDKGEVKEFDTPWNLFNVENSIFQQMCQRSNIVADDFENKEF